MTTDTVKIWWAVCIKKHGLRKWQVFSTELRYEELCVQRMGRLMFDTELMYNEWSGRENGVRKWHMLLGLGQYLTWWAFGIVMS